MESVLRGVAVYGILLMIFRLTGKRSLGQITTFDFILLLIISEAIQNAMVGTGHSVTNALVLILTLVVVDQALHAVKMRVSFLERWLEGAPLVIVENGRALEDRLRSRRASTSATCSMPRGSCMGWSAWTRSSTPSSSATATFSIIPHQPGAASARDRAA